MYNSERSDQISLDRPPSTVILGTKKKIRSAYNFAVDQGHDVHVLKIEKDYVHENDDAHLLSVSNDTLSHSTNHVINFKETLPYLEAEKAIAPSSFLNNANMKFFSSKSEQDRVCKAIDVPTIPNKSDTVLVKTDYSGGTGFYVCSRKDLKDERAFVQDYLNIKYVASAHFYAREGVWYWLNTHVMKYENNCPSLSLTTPKIDAVVERTISSSVDKLRDLLYINNKLFGWQFMVDEHDNIYSMDFNLRPFGGFEMGSYDTDVSDQQWTSFLYGAPVPEYILYTHQIKCIYDQTEQFGYHKWDRVKTANKISFEVKTYD